MSSFEWPPRSGTGSGVVTSLNGDTGAVTIAAGTGISLSNVANTITVTNTSPASSLTIGTYDSQSPAANGLVLSSSVLYAQSADATHPGMVNNTTQTFSGNKRFSGHAAIGSGSSIGSFTTLDVEETYTSVASTSIGIKNYLTYNPSGTSSLSVYGTDTVAKIQSGNAQTYTGSLVGTLSTVDNVGSNGDATLIGIYGLSNATGSGGSYLSAAVAFQTNGGAGPMQFGYGSYGTAFAGDGGANFLAGYYASAGVGGAGNVDNSYGIYIDYPGMFGSGTITNNYGMYIEDQSFGTTSSYALYSNGGFVQLKGHTGIGANSNPSTGVVLDITEYVNDTSMDHTGINVGLVYSPFSSSSNAITGLLVSSAIIGGSAFSGNINGLSVNASNATTGDGSTASVYGINAQASAGSGGGNVICMAFQSISADVHTSTLAGAFGTTAIIGTGDVDNAYGIYVGNDNYGTGDINHAYGLYVKSPTILHAGTINENYGIRIQDQSGFAVSYAIYSNGGQSYHAGNFGIANLSPGALLDIGTAGSILGTLRLEGNTSGYVQLQSSAAAGSWTMTLPTSAGTSGYALTTNGSGVTSWSNLSSTYLPLAGGTMSGVINMGSNKITNVTDPTSAQDAATKNYVDNVAAGINPAVAVQAATTAAGNTSGFTYNNGVSGIGATLTGSVNTAVVIDGYTFTALGQRLLVKNDTQSPSGAFNGIYYVTQVQTALLAPILTRALDYDMPSDINNTGAIPVINGTVNGTTQWVITSLVNTVGTDPLTFTQFAKNPADYLLKANNLSDVASSSTSFNNISGLTTLGDLIYGGASGTRSRLAGNTTTTAKFLNQTGDGANSVAPSWSQVGLTTGVTGTLPIANGGTGQTTANAGFNALSPMTTGGDIIYGGASGVGTRLANGSSGQVLTSAGGTSAPTWTTPTSGLITNWADESGNFTFNGLGTVSALSIWTRRVGDTLYVRGYGTCGTVAASTVSIGLPGGYVIASTKFGSTANVQKVGWMVALENGTNNVFSSVSFALFYDGSGTATIYASQQESAKAYTTFNGNSVFGNGDKFNFDMEFPIVAFAF